MTRAELIKALRAGDPELVAALCVALDARLHAATVESQFERDLDPEASRAAAQAVRLAEATAPAPVR